ncbi:unnamed protein product [Gongylonema pulchrum]|uniref:Progestin and adipoQ receptor family member 6 n=1 Tax=Gongylonema pulchrum TaxID=637853 RepID=A0A183DCR4_9BILA|nr:unnamed protein product [Gongylonema pulchrum]
MANSHNVKNTPHSSCQLLRKSDLEPCFWINQYVQTGYRPTHLSSTQTLQWNNETINIWTHLTGFFYFTWRQYVANICFLPATNAFPSDYLIVTACLLGFQVFFISPSFKSYKSEL